MKKKLEQHLFLWPSVIIADRDLFCFFEECSKKAQQDIIERAVIWGWLNRVKKGLFFVGPPFRSDKPSCFEIAQHVYGPSYISMESALSYHGMIPEAVYATVSATSLRSKDIHTSLGLYIFHHVPSAHFYEGVEQIQEGTSTFLVATPLKAIGDYIYIHKKEYRHASDMAKDLRIEIDVFRDQPVELLRLLEEHYPSRRVQQFYKNYREEFF